jgi:hypothetical protein
MPRFDVRIHKPKKGAPTLSPDRKYVSVRVPLKLFDRGGSKLVVTPDGSNASSNPTMHIDSTTKALARAFRWRKLLETGAYNSIEDLARAEKINASYVSRVLRLTLLAPRIVQDLLDSGNALNFGASKLAVRFPTEWQLQTRALILGRNHS